MDTAGAPSSDATTISLSQTERLNGRENFDFYCGLILPFIESSWLGAISLLMLCPPDSGTHTSEGSLELKQAQDAAQLLGKTLYHQGDLSYFEAVNKETLRNSYVRSEEEGIIIVSKPKDSKAPPQVRLAPEWTPKRDYEGKLVAEGKLWELCERIGQGRREGENRRDEATVRSRVLGLVEMVGSKLWQGSQVQPATSAEGVALKARRRRALQTTPRL